MRVHPISLQLPVRVSERVLEVRGYVAWAWLLACVALGVDVAPAASFAVAAALLIVAGRWSRTVRNGGLAMVLLLDAPVAAVVVMREGFSASAMVLLGAMAVGTVVVARR